MTLNASSTSIGIILQVEPKVITRSIGEVLPDAEVTLGCGDRRMAQGELNLFQRSVSFVGQLRERAPQIMGRHREFQIDSIAPNDLIDRFSGHGFADDLVALIDWP